MDDTQIVELYWTRSENAIQETAAKYSAYCGRIATSILGSDRDVDECINDTWLRTWQEIPPKRPENLATFLGKITRNLAIDRLRINQAEKRGEGQLELALEELRECIAGNGGPQEEMERKLLVETLNRFLEKQKPEARKIFMRRYWLLSPVQEIAQCYGISQSKVKMTLMRMRNQLKQELEKEGILV